MRIHGWLCVVSLLCAAGGSRSLAQGPPTAPDRPSESPAGWFARVTRTQAAQPHWVTPLVTVTPRLEEEFRYDISRQQRTDGSTLLNFGGGKGLELIPAERVEIIAGLPPYLVHRQSSVSDGIGDMPLLLKYRLLAANEEKGNYILTVFLGVSFPIAYAANGSGRTVITPSVAYGKGWGRFDVQGTLGLSIPTGDVAQLGRPIAWNNAFQYHPWRRVWPQVEVNATFFPDGKNAGKKQVFLTPGLILGRFPLYKRLALTFGAGVQIATTEFHTSNHNVILSVRFPF